MIDLQRSLDIILEDGPVDGPKPQELASELVQQLQDARQQVADIEHKLTNIKYRISADLALSLRRAQPGLNVALDKNGCKVGYKTKLLHFIPDIENGIWKVISPNRRFLREFLNAHRRVTLMDNDLSTLVTAITAYFANYYRTLGEEIGGTGALLIEEKRGTLLELVAWREGNLDRQQPLKSRLGRKVSG